MRDRPPLFTWDRSYGWPGKLLTVVIDVLLLLALLALLGGTDA